MTTPTAVEPTPYQAEQTRKVFKALFIMLGVFAVQVLAAVTLTHWSLDPCGGPGWDAWIPIAASIVSAALGAGFCVYLGLTYLRLKWGWIGWGLLSVATAITPLFFTWGGLLVTGLAAATGHCA